MTALYLWMKEHKKGAGVAQIKFWQQLKICRYVKIISEISICHILTAHILAINYEQQMLFTLSV